MKKPWCYIQIGEAKVKIDKEDEARVTNHTWRIRKRSDAEKLSIYTSVRKLNKTQHISLGRFLMKPPKGKVVYPRRYFDEFDYRKENLIVCTMQERQRMLPKKKKEQSSAYRGVSYSKNEKLWRASITVDAKLIYLGNFETEKEAALAYNTASKKYFGKDGYQNSFRQTPERRR